MLTSLLVSKIEKLLFIWHKQKNLKKSIYKEQNIFKVKINIVHTLRRKKNRYFHDYLWKIKNLDW